MSNRGTINKAVIPVAGLGTRFLPATKATPKEMLPVVDKPAIQYVVEEAVAAGINDVLFVTGRNKDSLENHFDRAPSLERTLAERGAFEMQSEISELADLAAMHYVRQGVPMGLGHAVSMAKEHVGNQAFAVLLGDDLVDVKTPVLQDMFAAQAKFGGSILALMDMPAESGGGVHAVIFRGKRYDTGDKLSYLKSVVSIALDRDDLGPDLRTWLTSYLAGKN